MPITYCIIVKSEAKLSKSKTKREQLEKCTVERKEGYNKEINERCDRMNREAGTVAYKDLEAIINEAKRKHIPRVAAKAV